MAALLASLLLGAASTLATAGDAAQWQALFAAVPGLPATPGEAATKISARIVHSEGLGIAQLRIEIADPALHALQRQADQLHEPIVKALAAQFQRTMDAANKDPAVTELARKLDGAWKPDPSMPDRPPSLEAMRRLNSEVERVLGPMPAPGAALPPPRTEIAAYRRELQFATPRASQFLVRLADQQRRYAQQHAQADREAVDKLAGSDVASAAQALVAKHHALAQQQLNEAATVLREAREALAPRVRRLAELAGAAELRNAPASERNEAYAPLKAYVEFLLTLQRETLQDVGFWGGTGVARSLPLPDRAHTHWLYEFSQVPGFNLRADGKQPYGQAYYPLGRAIVVGLPPGIR